MEKMINSQSAAAVNSVSKSIVNALEKSLKKINKVENSDNPMFSGWIKVKEDVRIVVWAGRCYDAETKTYSFSGTFTLESKNHRDEYTNDVDCLVGVTSTDRLSDDQCIALIIDEFKKKLAYWMGSEYEILSRNAYVIDYCYFGGAKKEAPALDESPALDEAPELEEAPELDEVKILEDFCTNEASKIKTAGLTSVALSEEEHYLYDYEALYDYLVDAGFNEDRAYEIRGQYDNEVDRAIRGLLTAPDFVPVEVSDSDIESTERFWDNITIPYSARGLAYAKEHTNGVSMADIIRAVAEEHWNFESVVKESQWTRFTNDSFRDLIWSTCWAEYLVGHTDEAIEAETRYVLDFDSVYDDLFDELWPYMSTYDDSCGGCELWVNAWYVVERAAEIIEERGDRWIDWDEFPGYVMDAFLGDLYGFDTFTERVMSELEGGDIIGIMPYDNGLHLSFVNDEAEVAA